MLIFWESDKKKNTFLVKFLWQVKKDNFQLKMLKLPENHVKTQQVVFFFKFLNKPIILKILTKKSFFDTFCSKFSKILPNSKNWKKKQKTIPREVS